MKIVGFNFKKASVERKNDIHGKLNIKTNIDIVDVEKDDSTIAKDALKIRFNFSVLYDPNFAELTFEGFILVIPEDSKKFLKDWKKKQLPDDLRLPILNFIISKCSIKALQLEEEFALPPHIPLPRVSKQQQNSATSTNYTG